MNCILSYCSATGESQGKLIKAITNAPIWQKNPKTTRGLRPIKRLRYVPKMPKAKPPMISPTPTTKKNNKIKINFCVKKF